MQKNAKQFPLEHYGFLAHYYRAEVYRETAWRNRLDVTTNWSILITAAILTFVFGNPNISHAVIIINYLIVWFFLYIEARRFRYYSIVHDRVRVFEKNVLGNLFSLRLIPKDSMVKISELADKLSNPKIKMSRIESLSWRLRRVYVFILPILFLTWLYKVSSFPQTVASSTEFLQNARVGFVPGIVIYVFMSVSLIGAIFVAFNISRKYGQSDLP